MEWIKLNGNSDDEIPELEDNSVLIHYENGSIETAHIEDMFDNITCGLDQDGNQLYTKWYINHSPKVTHWMPLPEPPKE